MKCYRGDLLGPDEVVVHTSSVLRTGLEVLPADLNHLMTRTQAGPLASRLGRCAELPPSALDAVR